MRILLWTVALLSVAALVVWISFDRIAVRGIDYALEKQGIPVKSYRIVSLSRSHVVFKDVALGDHGEVTAAQVDLRIGWNGNKAETFDLQLGDADIMATLTGGKLSLDGIERVWHQEPLAPSKDTINLRAVGDVTLHYAMGGEAKMQANAVTLTASRDAQDLVLPLLLDGTAEGNMKKTLTYTGTLVSEKKQLNGRFSGSYDMAGAKGSTQWSVEPIRFTPGGFTFHQLSPFYASEVPTFPMRLSAKGVLTLAKGSWSLTPQLTFHELPLETLLASVLGEDAKVNGIVTGGIPLTVTPNNWRIKPASLSNKGGLTIAVSPVGRAADMLQTHPQSQVVLAALGNFHVDEMSLNAKSTDDHGGMSLKWHFLGANPELYGGKKIDFTLAVNANLEDIWISATQAEKLAQKAQGNAQGAKQ